MELNIPSAPFIIGLVLVIVGIIFIIISSIRLMGGSKGESAGLILIGPIPIIWGSSRRALALTALAIALALLVIIVLWTFNVVGG
ncbi:MAG: TIGR00304 family membrane protein [Candidatus Nezhaarchaeales archaeon]